MYWIMMIVLGVFLILLYLARKEDVPQDIMWILKPFSKIARFLYKKIGVCHPGLFASRHVEQDLLRLHPGETGECLKTEYYVKKIALSLAVILVGTLFGAAAKLSARGEIILGEGNAVARGGYRDESREINIVADLADEKMDFFVQVEPRKLTEEEAKTLLEDFCGLLPEYILGDNESLQKVTSDLFLAESYEDYPIALEWDSSRPDLLSDTGRISSVENEEVVLLSVKLSYGEYFREDEIAVTLIPPILTKEEQLYKEIEELLLQSQIDSLEQEEWQLPTEWQGEQIEWQQIVKDYGIVVWAAALATAVLVYLGSDKDLHDRLEKRKKSLRREYPEIVHKLVLFVGAGITIRGAFRKIAGDYEVKKKAGGKQLPAYEEMLYTCRELSSGVSESAAYEHFGKRTGLQEYIRLSALLVQNLKRGNSTLLERLREEADQAAREQLQQSKKLGEEAGTKLLVPMVLMLAVVMVVIMIPAFSTI